MAAELFDSCGIIEIPEIGQCKIVSWSEAIPARPGSERSVFINYLPPPFNEVKAIRIHLFKVSDP